MDKDIDEQQFKEWAWSLLEVVGVKGEGVWATHLGFPAYYGDLRIEEGMPRLFLPSNEWAIAESKYSRYRRGGKPYTVWLSGNELVKANPVEYKTMSVRKSKVADPVVRLLFIREDWFKVIQEALNGEMVTGKLVEKVDTHAYLGESW